MTLQEHLDRNRTKIETEARIYAKSYRVSYDKALRDVRDEYINGYNAEQWEHVFAPNDTAASQAAAYVAADRRDFHIVECLDTQRRAGVGTPKERLRHNNAVD